MYCDSENRVPAFPTHMGVNRARVRPPAVALSLPHARGGEPARGKQTILSGVAFPTHVGLNQYGLSAPFGKYV